MAGIVALQVSWRGLDQLHASFATLSEAMTNAHADHDIVEISSTSTGIEANGLTIVDLRRELGDGIVLALHPTASMILFASFIMTLMPSTATVRWQDGWPHFHCPPNNERDQEDDPTPLVPNELVPT